MNTNKLLITANLVVAILLLAATGRGETTQTNISATISITVTTNTCAPDQYRNYESYMEGGGREWWSDSKPYSPFQNNPFMGVKQQTRPNPDVRITEVHEVRILCFKFEEKQYDFVLYDKILSTVTEDRVETTETTTKDGCKVTTIVEQWKRREP